MATLDLEAVTPETSVAAADEFFFADVSDGTPPTTITAAKLLNAVAAVADAVFAVGTGETVTIAAGTGTQVPALTVTGAAHTALTASTESKGLYLNFSATKQWATGALTTQREVHIDGPTYAFVGASTITEADTLYVKAPVAGTNATITRNSAILCDGLLTVRQTGGTAGTDDARISHNGTNILIINADGSNGTVLGDPGVNQMLVNRTGAAVGASSLVGWSSIDNNATGAMDTTLRRAGVAGVVGIGDGAGTAGKTLRSIPLTPAQITANQNNYAPGTAWFYRLSTDASRDITGLSTSQVSGQVAEVWNVGAQNIVLKNQDANSTDVNRFICTGGADITLAADEVALLRYDGTTQRWRVRKV